MSTIKYIRHTLILGLALLLSGPVFAVEGALLGLTTGAPVITTNPIGSCTYDAAAQVLSIETQPFFITFDGLGGSNNNNVFNAAGTAIGGIATYTLNIDNSGNLTTAGSTVTVTGLTQDTLTTAIYGTPLLTGNITNFGIRDDGVNDVMDIQATVVSGVPAAPGVALDTIFPPGSDIASTFLLNISTYSDATGSGFAVNANGANEIPTNGGWNCAGATATLGSFQAVQEGCNLSIVKTASTPTVGPPAPKYDGDDSDSDSGRDHDGSGDSDDSDSDSEASSADSDGGAMSCGCKSRVTQLTMRWNSLTSSTVSVTKKNGQVLFPPTVVLPGEEFTFPVNGKKIKLIADGNVVETLKTKCKNPIGPGQKLGNFEVVSGLSKWSATIPLCPFPGTTCGPEFEVTYTYAVSNSGPGSANNVVVYDDQLGVVDSYTTNPNLVSIPANGTETILTTVCVFETTTNVATAFGDSISGEACTFTDGGNTATVVEIPAPCDPGDSDSDSGSDNNASGDSDDDSDSDSSPGDCDGDGT